MLERVSEGVQPDGPQKLPFLRAGVKDPKSLCSPPPPFPFSTAKCGGSGGKVRQPAGTDVRFQVKFFVFFWDLASHWV